MTELYNSNGATTLAEALDASETDVDLTSLSALIGTGATGDTFSFMVDSEIFRGVYPASGNTVVVTRGAEGSTAATHSNGAAVTAVITESALTQIKADSNPQSLSANRGQTVLAAHFNVTSLTTVLQDTGLFIDLPSAGTYEIISSVQSYVISGASGNARMFGQLVNTTDTANVGPLKALAWSEAVNSAATNTTNWVVHVTVAGAKRITLWASCTFTSATGARIIMGASGDGTTSLTWKKIA